MLTAQIRLTFSIFYFHGMSSKVDFFRSLSLPRDHPMWFYITYQGLFSILTVLTSDPAILHLLFLLFEKYYIFAFCLSSLRHHRLPTWYTYYCILSAIQFVLSYFEKSGKKCKFTGLVPNRNLRIHSYLKKRPTGKTPEFPVAQSAPGNRKIRKKNYVA